MLFSIFQSFIYEIYSSGSKGYWLPYYDVFSHSAELKERINKHILVVEYSRDLIMFVKNIFYRFGVKEININWKEGQTNVLVTVEQNEVGKAIGKEGRNIKLFRDAVQRYYNIKSLNIKQI